MREAEMLMEALRFSVILHESGDAPSRSRAVLDALSAPAPERAGLLVKLADQHAGLRSSMPLTMSWAETASRPARVICPGPSSHTIIHTDGACSGNPGPGGWAVIVDQNGQRAARYGGDPATTNNRMEMTAMIVALREAAAAGGQVMIRADSEYVIKGLTEWMPGWAARGWRNASGKPVVNRDLWEEMSVARAEAEAAGALVVMEHVRGHSGDPGNEACDELAVRGRDEARGEPAPFEAAVDPVSAGYLSP